MLMPQSEDAGLAGRLADPERTIAVAWAPARARAGLTALFRLDEVLARTVRTTSEPMIGQMRLTWWHDALCALDTAPPPAEPVLRALAASVVGPVTGASLARLVEGWEELLDPEWNADTLARYANRRGACLFAAAARLLNAEADSVEQAGRGWALVDLARGTSDPTVRRSALAQAQEALSATTGHWSIAGRPLGMLARLARRDVARGVERQGSPARLLAMAGHRMTGR